MIQVPQEELERWIRDSAARLQGAADYTVARVHENEFFLLYGVLTRTIHLADTFLDLVGTGRAADAVPLARTALEYAITAQWVFTVDGGVDRWRRDVEHDRYDHYRTLSEWLSDEDLAREARRLPEPEAGKRLPKFMAMLRDLDHQRLLETSYLVLSQQVHVTHAAVMAAIEGDENGNLHLSATDEYAYSYQAIYVSAIACMLARWILAKLTNDVEELRRLDAVSDDLYLPVTLIDQLPETRRRRGLSSAPPSDIAEAQSS